MSSSAPGGPSVSRDDDDRPGEKKKGLGRMLSRMRTALKRSPSKRQSSGAEGSASAPASTSNPTPAPAPAPAPASISTPAPACAPIPTSTPALTPIEAPTPASTTTPRAGAETPIPEATRIPRSQLFEERARKLAERYGLEIQPTEWHVGGPDDYVLRVEKPIKMRVHRHCHECRALGVASAFGLARECPSCGHARCTRCPRTPPRRTDAERDAARRRRAVLARERHEMGPIVPQWAGGLEPPAATMAAVAAERTALRRPARSAAGQDLVHKKPRQRVRRTCCQSECGKLFASGSKACEGCGHMRCTDCARDPPKKDKYPYGYPGDELGTKLGHFRCHECGVVYQSNPQVEGECPRCQHTRCGVCQRLRPCKVEPEPDPEMWKAVQARLEELRIK